jgi:hypothetical protein
VERDMEIKLVLNIEKVNVILQTLAKRPYKDVAPLILEIEAQGKMQIEMATAAETKKENEDEVPN